MTDVVIDPDSLKRMRTLLNSTKKGTNQSLSRSLNRGRTAAVTRASKRVREISTLKSAVIKRFTQQDKATPAKLITTISFSTPKIPLINYSHSVTKKSGVSFRIFKKGPRERYKHAFIATVNQDRSNTHKGIFERVVKGGVVVGRFPIKEKFGPSVGTLIEQTPGVFEDVQQRGLEVLSNELENQVNRLLGA